MTLPFVCSVCAWTKVLSPFVTCNPCYRIMRGLGVVAQPLARLRPLPCNMQDKELDVQACAERLYASVQRRKSRVPVHLSLSDVNRLVSLSKYICYYCGRCCESVGIDRLCSFLPYTFSNCVVCCSVCNFAKGRLDVFVFTNHVERMLANHMRSSKVVM